MIPLLYREKHYQLITAKPGKDIPDSWRDRPVGGHTVVPRGGGDNDWLPSRRASSAASSIVDRQDDGLPARMSSSSSAPEPGTRVGCPHVLLVLVHDEQASEGPQARSIQPPLLPTARRPEALCRSRSRDAANGRHRMIIHCTEAPRHQTPGDNAIAFGTSPATAGAQCLP